MVEEQNIVGLELEQDQGQVQIADDVIAVIAEIAALEVEGMAATGNTKTDFVQAISRKKTGKGIKVEVGEGCVSIDVTGSVKYGVKIPEVCVNVQKKVKSSVETMTGLEVTQVNVHIVGVVFEKEPEL